MLRNVNQPFNSNPSINDIPLAGLDTEGHYRTIDDVFRPCYSYYLDSTFVTVRKEHGHIRQRYYYQRDELEQS